MIAAPLTRALLTGAVAATALTALAAPASAHRATIGCGHRLERQRGRGRARRVHLTRQRPTPRVAALRHDARGHPRRAQRDRPAIKPYAYQPAGRSGGVARRRRGRGGPRRARPAARSSRSRSRRRASTPASRASRPTSAALGAIPAGPAKTRASLGQAAAAAILELRADDGSDKPLLAPTTHRGPSQASTASRPDAVRVPAGWASVTPFVLRTARSSAPGPPYAVTSAQYTADFNEVKRARRRRRHHAERPHADQTQIALFWVESSPLQWNRIARTVCRPTGLGLWESARLFGLLNMAMADGYIGSLETKYHYNYWRPVTAIQLAATDGNPDTGPTRAGRRWCRRRRSRTTTRHTPSRAGPPRRC